MSTDLQPRLSIVLPTTEGWTHVADMAAQLSAQLEVVDGEVVVVDGVPEIDAETVLPKHVRRIVVEGGSVFDLRARGIVEARGEFVAVTEDHCELPRDWCAKVVAAHEAHPEVEAIGGAVDNGSRRTIGDWANFFVTFGAFAPPVTLGVRRGLTIANSSYKRSVLAGAPDRAGWLEFDLHARLLEPGRALLTDQITVRHVQPRSVAEGVRLHFHNGRTTTGLARDGWSRPLRRRRLVHALRLGPSLLTQTMTTVWPKRDYRRQLLRSSGAIALVCLAHSVGELVGLLRGPGTSARHLA